MWNAINGTRVVSVLLLGLVGLAVVACAKAETVDNSDVTPEPLTSFFIEARIQTDADESESPFPPDGPLTSTLRWWFEAPDRFRWETESSANPYLSTASLAVSDGDRWTSYDATLNRYQSSPAVQYPDSVVPTPSLGILIGPLRGGSVAEWIKGMRVDQPRFDAKLLRDEELLGRRVGVYEFSPVGVYLDTEGTIAAGSTGRIWIDESIGFILKYESPDHDNVTAKVTNLVVNQEIDEERFAFVAPAGAVEAESSTSSITLSGGVGEDGRPGTPLGLLEIGYVPPEFVGATQGGSSTGQSMGIVNRAENTWVSANGHALRVRQFISVPGLPGAYVSDEQALSTAAVNGPYNVLRSEDETMISLAWQDGDIAVIVDGIGLDLSELINVASMTLPAEG